MEEIKEDRKLVAYYSIEPSISFDIYDDGYMEMEYRGEEPCDPDDPGFSVRRERIFPDTERYKEILELTKEMVLMPNVGGSLIPDYDKHPKEYVTKEMFEKLKEYLSE